MTYQEYRATKYFPQLDGVRAVSVLMVISVHVQDQAFGRVAGFLGVTLFFVISGFLITTLALREEADKGTLNLKAFYIRRTFRILPLYYLALAVYAVLHLMPGIQPEKKALFFSRMSSYLFYYQEIPHFCEAGNAAPFHHSWSLGIEEKFYLIWPLIAFVLLKYAKDIRLTVALLLSATFGLMPILSMYGYPGLAGCLTPYHFILLGCCLALMLHSPAIFEQMQFFGKLHFVLLVFVGLVAVQYAMPASMERGFGAGWQTVYGLIGALFITVMFMRDGPLRWFFEWKPLVWVGTLSYGIYLFHLIPLSRVQKWSEGKITPAMQPYFSLFAASVLSIIGAFVLSLIVEKPMIRLGRKYANRAKERANGAA